MRSFRQTVLTKSSREKLLRWVSLALMLAIAALYFSLPAFAQNKYVITDGDNVIVCMSASTDPQVVIREAGLELGESDTYTTQKQDGVSQIKINRVQMVSVYEGGQMSVVGSYGGTVADILDALDLTLSPNDVLSCSLDTETYDGMDIRIPKPIPSPMRSPSPLRPSATKAAPWLPARRSPWWKVPTAFAAIPPK